MIMNDPIYRVYQNLGMNRNISEFLPLKGEWRLVVNADMKKLGVYKKRDGYTKILNNPDNAEILSIIPFELGGVFKLIMINAAGKMYVADPIVDSTWGTAKFTGLDTAARWTGTVMSDSTGVKYMIIGNGITVKKTSDASTFSDVAGAPLGKYWEQLMQRVMCSGVPADTDQIHASVTGDLTNWSTVSPADSYSQPIDRFSRGQVKGLKVSNDRLIIYKQKCIKSWDGDYLKSVMASTGLDAPYSLSEIEGMIFSLDRDAIRLYDGTSPVPITEKIQDIIDGINFASTNVERICGEVFKKRYYLCLGDVTDEDGNTITNCWVVYDYSKNLIWLYSMGHQMTSIKKLVCSDGVERFYAGDVSGNFYQLFSGNDLDDDKNVEMDIRGHKVYPAGPEAIITPKKVTVASRFADEMKVTLVCDDSDPVNVGELTDSITQNLTDETGNNVRGFELQIRHASKGRPEFKGWSVQYELTSQNRV